MASEQSVTSIVEATRCIELRGVRVHNLKCIDVDIPLDRFVVISGVSGSGKSSLAFDTIFAEGQRRFIESFSASAREYLERIERPDADRIAHVPPTIAIRTETSHRSALVRASVASLVEIDVALRALFSRIGQLVCPTCQTIVRPTSSAEVVQAVSTLPDGTRLQLCFVPPDLEEPDSLTGWHKRGFTRAISAGRTLSLEQAPRNQPIWIVVDRLVSGKSPVERIAESAEAAFREGNGRCVLLVEAATLSSPSDPSISGVHGESIAIDDRTWQSVRFSRHWECTTCSREYFPPEPRLFEPGFDGGCKQCQGVDTNNSCPVCHGTNLCEQALSVRIGQRNLAEIQADSIAHASQNIHELSAEVSESARQQSQFILDDLRRRLEIVMESGLGHLVLRRRAKTLSEGQVRRLMLASAIGSRVTGTLCLIDEPSAGLAVSEIPHVISMIRRLLERRNSVIVVDHSPAMIRAADHVIDLGPGAGPQGGTIVFQGRPDQLSSAEGSATGRALGNPADVAKPESARRVPGDWITLRGVRHRNLIVDEIRFPLGVLCVVCGPGGSGKTSLVIETLIPALQQRLGVVPATPYGSIESFAGGDSLVEVAVVDQSPLVRSSRSNAATWIDVFDEIREVFAMTSDARQRGFGPQHFSFNTAQGGRCRACRGTGFLRQDMQFLPDVTLTCPECRGTRYRRDLLDIKYRGRSIADVLSMSAAEAAVFFRNHHRLQSRLQMLKQIGLDYLVLGQPTDTLSGGEAQRLKLASRLTTGRGPTLIACDEPTNGLHPADIGCLVDCFSQLLDIGHSIVLVDNDPLLLRHADYVIEMGPGSASQSLETGHRARDNRRRK